MRRFFFFCFFFSSCFAVKAGVHFFHLKQVQHNQISKSASSVMCSHPAGSSRKHQHWVKYNFSNKTDVRVWPISHNSHSSSLSTLQSGASRASLWLFLSDKHRNWEEGASEVTMLHRMISSSSPSASLRDFNLQPLRALIPGSCCFSLHSETQRESV